MSDETEAAGITQMAAQAADALTKVAAAEAAAVVEVAAAAHANLAPSVLVVSMFETLQHQIQQVAGRLEEGNHWMAMADQRHEKMSDGIDTLSNRVDRQNGGVAKALNWIAEHDARMESAAIMAAGRKAQRSDDMAVVRGVQTFLSDYAPLIIGIAIGAVGVGAVIWDWGPW